MSVAKHDAGCDRRRADCPYLCTCGLSAEAVSAARATNAAGRLRAALEQIALHADMPAGESWEQAYVEVTSMARTALAEVPRP
jgi:hypothetical protein